MSLFIVELPEKGVYCLLGERRETARKKMSLKGDHDFGTEGRGSRGGGWGGGG